MPFSSNFLIFESLKLLKIFDSLKVLNNKEGHVAYRIKDHRRGNYVHTIFIFTGFKITGKIVLFKLYFQCNIFSGGIGV